MDFTTSPHFAVAVKEGIREALLDPAFRSALFEHVAQAAAEYVWLTRKEVAAMTGGRSEKTIARWAKKNLLEVNDKLSLKEHLYSLSSVQNALKSGAIREKKTPRAKPLNAASVTPMNGQPAAAAPLRGVTISRL